MSNDTKREVYQSMLRNKENYIQYGCCINQCQYKSRGRTNRCNYSNADENNERACDFCVKTKRLCARFVEVGNEIKFSIYPLSASFRASTVKWNDLEYWVRAKPMAALQ
jgi:hypothetical protein